MMIFLAGLLLAWSGRGEPAQATVQEAAVQLTVATTILPTATENPLSTSIYTTTEKPMKMTEPMVQEIPIPAGSRPHDVAPARDQTVWYTAQGSGELG